MKSSIILSLAALGVGKVAAHATFQQLWVDGVDMQSSCARLPQSNNPVQNVASTDMRCNVGGSSGVSGKCPVVAGGTVTVEMHAQPGDRKCANPAIGGQHYGPVQVYLSKVADSQTADGSAGWFKIFQDTWSKKSGSAVGDNDNWGTNDLNTCCGRMNVKIPSDIAAGDYLLRAEALALHTAGSSGQAQFYMTCYQLQITGGGSATPATVNLPGSYSASDPGILVNIHQALSGYTAPGPAVYSGGSTKVAGAACVGAEAGTGVGPAYTPTNTPAAGTGGTGGTGGSGGCTAAKYGQCGGQGWTGCTACAGGATCQAVSPPYYSQCA